MATEKNILTNNIQTIIMVLSLLGGIIAGMYGFVQWIDDRYVNTDEYLKLSLRTVVAMYDQRIVDLKRHEKYLLEYKPNEINEIKFIRKQIKEIKEHRLYFLQTGHYPIGDNLIIDRNRLTKEFK